jgi:hypothetical protein
MSITLLYLITAAIVTALLVSLAFRMGRLEGREDIKTAYRFRRQPVRDWLNDLDDEIDIDIICEHALTSQKFPPAR